MASRKGPPPIVYILATIAIGFGAYGLFFHTDMTRSDSEERTDGASLKNHISRGEKILIDSGVKNEGAVKYKQQASNAIAEGYYSQAVDYLEAALEKDKNDPEALIYLNNARIGNEEALEIAVTVPITDDTVFYAEEMLRGYAQAQHEINQAGGINGTPIKLTLVDDNDDPNWAAQLVNKLAKQDDILAVTGHWSSGTTLEAASAYKENELVLVNPVSTTTELSDINDYVFRTIPSNFVVAATMADYATNELNANNVAIFYDSASEYSLSLRKELETAISTYGGNILWWQHY